MVVEMLAASVASVMDALAANRLVAEGKGETEGEREREAQTPMAYQCTHASGAGVHTVRIEAEDCNPNRSNL